MDSEYTLKPQIFTLGAKGQKGKRLFFFQSIDAETSATISLKCEKSQIVAMARVLELLLENLPPKYNIPLEDLEPQEIDDSILSWVIGDLNVYYSWEKDEIELQVKRMPLPDELEEKVTDTIGDIEAIKFIISREQADGFLRMAQRLIELGRPLCEYCLSPLNEMPENNFCACWN